MTPPETLPMILCLCALALVVATAASGVAIAVLESRGVVPKLVESAFMGLAGVGSTALIASVVALHPATAGVAGDAFSLLPAGRDAVTVELVAELEGECFPPVADAAYDLPQENVYWGGIGREVPLFRSSGSR